MHSAGEVPHRNGIPAQWTWDLTTVYASDQEWEQAVANLQDLLPQVTALEGKVGQGAASLLHALTLRDEVGELLTQIRVYATMRKDSDSTDPVGQALTEKAGSLTARVQAALAFIEPEILAVLDETIARWLKKEKRLQVYDHALKEIARQRPHIRSAEVENVVAQYGDITRAPGEIFEILTDADLTFPTIEGENGEPVSLSHGRYRRFMESNNRRVREDTFHGYYHSFQTIRNTLGTSLAAAVRSHAVNARIRGYGSSLEAALKPNDIPLEVYHNLRATIEANLPRLHRYLGIRRRIMGLDELRIYDLYAPLVPEVDLAVPYEEAMDTIQAALAPLGQTYATALRQAFSCRWIDVYENIGKRSGAYSGGSYSTAPFILLNYQDLLNDMFTLAHELGHSMHSYFTRRTQPFVYGNYTIFLAEVASTLNEALLTEHLLTSRDEVALRKHLIVQQLEDIRTTIIRQTMFAGFELDIHMASEAGEPLTTDSLSRRYYDLVARYHGSEVVLDDDIALEWARIPHFYYNFYVYQYATGLSAALALSKLILTEGEAAVERYLRFLSSGSSRSSIDLLRDAGVDMTSPEPVQQAMDTFDHLLDQLDALMN